MPSLRRAKQKSRHLGSNSEVVTLSKRVRSIRTTDIDRRGAQRRLLRFPGRGREYPRKRFEYVSQRETSDMLVRGVQADPFAGRFPVPALRKQS